MAAVPLLDETNGSAAAPMIDSLAGFGAGRSDRALREIATERRPSRRLAIYAASAGFELAEELEHLCKRAVEPNVFFNPRFLAPAMPRLEDREVRLAVIRDGEQQSRLRLLMPFSIERPAIPLAAPILRTWASPFGPVGTPLLDRDDPAGVVEDFFSMLARPHLKMPRVIVLPELPLDGPVAGILRGVALAGNLPLVVTGKAERAYLRSELDGEAYLRETLSSHHLRGFGRMKRRLADQGLLVHRILRQPDEVRAGVEAFLQLESAGWKGRKGTAMAIDRYRAAFAREAVHGLAEQDLCRIHTLELDGRIVACVIVFIENGTAYTWKTAYDEALAAYSPGMLLMIEVTKSHLEDPNIALTDSCAVPDHKVMNRLWRERRPVGTLVIGLTQAADRATRQAAAQLHLYEETRHMARLIRQRVRKLIGRR